MAENILGTWPVGKLIRKFSLPSIVALVVNAVYNIVDQIFIGNIVGYMGNSATNIIFPLVTFSLGAAMLIGDGTSAYMSLKLGAKDKEAAQEGVISGIVCLFFISISSYLFDASKRISLIRTISWIFKCKVISFGSILSSRFLLPEGRVPHAGDDPAN